VGGVAREWTTVLDTELTPGSSYALDLIMTKHEPPDVDIAYDLTVR
jgi:hypothetical protein